MARSRKPGTAPRGRSSRNTGWNGVEQLRRGIDGKANGKSWKWQGHVDNGTDTSTNGFSFDVNAKGMSAVLEMLQNAGNNVNRMADDIVAKTAVEGRKTATEIEEDEFNLGQTWVHTPMVGGFGPGIPTWKSSSRYEPSVGGYVGISSAGNKLMLINFSFEKGHTFRDNKDKPGVSKARFTSQLANLFENDATWRKASPYWRPEGSKGRWHRWNIGDTRQGRHYFNQLVIAVDQGFQKALPRAQASFDRWMATSNRSYA